MNAERTQIQSQTIDIIRPLMALMVIGLHVRPYYTNGHESFMNGWYDASVITIFRVLFSVAVPFFFFISGYFFFNNLSEWNTSVWTDKMKKRVKTILIPYIIWNIIAFVGFIITRYAGVIIKGTQTIDLINCLNERGWLRLFWDRCLFGPVKADYINLLGITVGAGTPMNEPTWFLRDLMVVMLFTPLIWWLIKKGGKLFLTVVGCLYLIDLWVPFAGFSSKAFFLFSIGAWMSVNGRNMIDESYRHPIILSVLSLLSLFTASVSFRNNEWVYIISSRLFILFTIPSFLYFTSRLVNKKEFMQRDAVRNLSNSSFFVYLMHTVIIVDATYRLMNLVVPSDNKAVMFILLCVQTVTVFIICHLIWLVLKRFMPGTLKVLTGNRISDRQQ